jgi:hypothetical protein
VSKSFTHRNHEVVLKSWVSKYDGCQPTNYTIDGVGYPYPHRSKEGAIEKAREIIDRDYWLKVRNAVENRARMRSCGTEGRLMYENLCEHEDWQERLMELAPNLEIEHSADMAAAIVTNCFSRGLAQESQRDMENDERRWARITDPEPSSGSESI